VQQKRLVGRKRRLARLVDLYLHIGQCGERPLNQRFDLLPAQPAVPAPQRRQRYRAYVPYVLHHAHKVLQPTLDVFNLRPAAPVLLGREVDDILRRQEGRLGEHQHLTDLHLSLLARLAVELVVFGESLFELQRNPLAHHATRIDGVH
jgi:hypothetical protein